MGLLRFVATAVLSSALVSAVLFAIVSQLTPRVSEANTEFDIESEIGRLQAESDRLLAEIHRAQAAASLKFSEVSQETRKTAV
jgi:hypothetical protein